MSIGVLGEGSPGKAVIVLPTVKETSLLTDPKSIIRCPIRRRDSEIEVVLIIELPIIELPIPDITS
jgi:hypothetical protein